MVEAICLGHELLLPRSQINYDVPFKSHETVKLRNQNPLLIALSTKAQGDPHGQLRDQSHNTERLDCVGQTFGGASAHSGQCDHTIMLANYDLCTEACLPRWSCVALAQTDIDDIISQVAHLIQRTGNSIFLISVTSD